jgi:hypothetical protein
MLKQLPSRIPFLTATSTASLSPTFRSTSSLLHNPKFGAATMATQATFKIPKILNEPNVRTHASGSEGQWLLIEV